MHSIGLQQRMLPDCWGKPKHAAAASSCGVLINTLYVSDALQVNVMATLSRHQIFVPLEFISHIKAAVSRLRVSLFVA